MTTTTAGIAEATVLSTFLALGGHRQPLRARAGRRAYLEGAAAPGLPDLAGRQGQPHRPAPRRAPCAGAPRSFSAHMDTVQPGVGIKPRVEGGIVRSDGTTILGADDKAGITAILEALRAVHGGDTPVRPWRSSSPWRRRPASPGRRRST